MLVLDLKKGIDDLVMVYSKTKQSTTKILILYEKNNVNEVTFKCHVKLLAPAGSPCGKCVVTSKYCTNIPCNKTTPRSTVNFTLRSDRQNWSVLLCIPSRLNSMLLQ